MNPTYKLLTSEADYRDACDAVTARAEREILIFDRDLAALQFDQRQRLDALTTFLAGDTLRRARLVLHDPTPLERNAPRLMQLLARYSHAVEVRQTPENLRNLADTHLLADDSHGVRRFHVDQARSAVVFDDPSYIHPWRRRFEELWELSTPCLRGTTTGL